MIRTLKTFLHICVAIYSLWRASKVTSTWELSALSAETARDKWNHMSNQNRWRHPGGARSLNELSYWLVCVRDSNVSADSANASFPQLNYAKCGSIKTRKLSCKQICHRWGKFSHQLREAFLERPRAAAVVMNDVKRLMYLRRQFAWCENLMNAISLIGCTQLMTLEGKMNKVFSMKSRRKCPADLDTVARRFSQPFMHFSSSRW